ncbi:Uma2 family endonuclease [Pedobacter nyackensis]|uniref:Uma2 family endonuclease n=1 Tax=Pedobacter nyackensis TaxID=475255 RepID=UPI00292FAB93|nr:Uma2 family endonuclease [Pedobacter nyackensis]
MKNKKSTELNGAVKGKTYQIKEPVISKVSDIDLSATYSYASYLRWKFEERVELIKGKVFQMSAPSVNHQRLLGFLYTEIYVYLKNHRCEAFAAPFDVRFPDKSKADNKVYTVLQPDICVICDETKLDRRGCIGAPDIVVEVLSPSNNRKELKNKFDIYEEYGVREYWIVHPQERTLLKYMLSHDGVFVSGAPYEGRSEFTSDILPGFRLNVEELFSLMRVEEV